jgi:type I restriction enzyme S subunit
VLPLPDLTEQRLIVERLQQADQLRRTRRSALDLTDTFLSAAFLKLFGGPSENTQTYDRVQVEDLFGELQIPLPPLPLEEKFADLVEELEHLRAVQREALSQAEHLFQTLLHQAFSESA